MIDFKCGLYKFNRTTYWLKFDKTNRPQPYFFIAKDLGDKKWVIGNVVVEPGFYQPDSYYIYSHNGYNESWGNSYGWSKTLIDPDTIVPATQTNYIHYLFLTNVEVQTIVLADGSKPLEEVGEYVELFRIQRDKAIPMHLWDAKDRG